MCLFVVIFIPITSSHPQTTHPRSWFQESQSCAAEGMGKVAGSHMKKGIISVLFTTGFPGPCTLQADRGSDSWLMNLTERREFT